MNVWKELKILYVEDDTDTREGLERFLKRRFGRVYLAEDGEKGIEVFQTELPDLCIVDILLPGMSGLEMIEKMKGIHEECRYLVTSTVGEVETILSAIDLNIENYIVKPIDTTDFEIKLNNIASSIMQDRKAKAKTLLFSLSDKGKIEENLRQGVISIMKKACGKGPQNVTVFISRDTVDINLYGILNPMEKTLLAGKGNQGHVEEGRKLLYTTLQDEITSLIEHETKTQTVLHHVEVDSRSNHDRLLLK